MYVINHLIFTISSGRKTPFSVTMPVIKDFGVTSKAGFQHTIPRNIEKIDKYIKMLW